MAEPGREVLEEIRVGDESPRLLAPEGERHIVGHFRMADETYSATLRTSTRNVPDSLTSSKARRA